MAFQKLETTPDMTWAKENPEISKWLTSSDLKPRTQKNYRGFMYRFLTEHMELTPKQFLDLALSDRRKFLIDVKTKLGAIKSVAVAFNMKAAVNSFLMFHEADVQIVNKIKRRKVWKRRELRWQDAQRIVGKLREPYERVCRFMLVSGLGWDEFREINESSELQADILKQMGNDKNYVRIDLTPRKLNTEFWYTLVPKKYIPPLPAKTHDWYKDRGGNLLSQSEVGAQWRDAAQELDLWERGSGLHQLRSVFKSTCRKIGVADGAIEGQLGHHDAMNYGREWQDEAYVAKELSKFWAFVETGVTTEIHEDVVALKAQLAERDRQYAELEQHIDQRIEQALKGLLTKTEDRAKTPHRKKR